VHCPQRPELTSQYGESGLVQSLLALHGAAQTAEPYSVPIQRLPDGQSASVAQPHMGARGGAVRQREPWSLPLQSAAPAHLQMLSLVSQVAPNEAPFFWQWASVAHSTQRFCLSGVQRYGAFDLQAALQAPEVPAAGPPSARARAATRAL